MEPLSNVNPNQVILDSIPNIKDKIEKTINEMNQYLEYLKNEKSNEKDGISKRVESVLENGKETIELIDVVKLKIENAVFCCENYGFYIEKANNELIDRIIDIEERKMNIDVEPLQNKIDELKQTFINKKNKWNGRRLNQDEYKRKKEEMDQLHKAINAKGSKEREELEKIKQLEEWTGMKFGNIIFDSDVDNWKKETTLFCQKVLNKSNLIFLIEDEDDNIFGGYINAVIDNVGQRWIDDPKAFVFSLKSNGRLNGMMKFDIVDSLYSFLLFEWSFECLFLIGYGVEYDICVYKDNCKYLSSCCQSSFNYNGIQNALCGKPKYIPKRITVIQLI